MRSVSGITIAALSVLVGKVLAAGAGVQMFTPGDVPDDATSFFEYQVDTSSSQCQAFGGGLNIGYLFSPNDPSQPDGPGTYQVICGGSPSSWPAGTVQCPNPQTESPSEAVVTLGYYYNQPASVHQTPMTFAQCDAVYCGPRIETCERKSLNFLSQSWCVQGSTLVISQGANGAASYFQCKENAQIDPSVDTVVQPPASGNGVAAAISGTNIGSDGAVPTAQCNAGFENVGNQCVLRASSLPRRARRRDGSFRRSISLPGF